MAQLPQPSYTARVAAATGAAAPTSTGGPAPQQPRATVSATAARPLPAATARTAVPRRSSAPVPGSAVLAQAPPPPAVALPAAAVSTATAPAQLFSAVAPGVALQPQAKSAGTPNHPMSPGWRQVAGQGPPHMVMVQQSQAHSPSTPRPPSQPPPTTRTAVHVPTVRSLSQPPGFAHMSSPHVEVLTSLSQSSSGERTLITIPRAAPTASGMSGVLAGAPSLPTWPPTEQAHSVERSCVVRRTFERERGREEPCSTARYGDVAAEVAALRQLVEAQRQQLAALAEQLGSSAGGGFAAALDAVKGSVAELQRQQDLQANALRDGLMEIHQQRAELVQYRGSPDNGLLHELARSADVLSQRLAAESEERRTSTAELNAHLENEITEVLRKVGRQHEELIGAFDCERADREAALACEGEARHQQLTELASALAAGGVHLRDEEAPENGSQYDGGRASQAEEVHMNLVAKLSEALEAERVARSSENTELRAMISQLATTVHRLFQQFDKTGEPSPSFFSPGAALLCDDGSRGSRRAGEVHLSLGHEEAGSAYFGVLSGNALEGPHGDSPSSTVY